MTWIPVAVNPEEVTAEYLYDMAKKHRLIPANMADAVMYFKGICSNCAVIAVNDNETGEDVGHVIFTEIADNESAQVDFIPKPKFFSSANPTFRDDINEALSPVFESLIEGRNLRRITAMVPRTRNRTKKALAACGFKKEGIIRKGVKFVGKDAEDIIIMGLLSSKE